MFEQPNSISSESRLEPRFDETMKLLYQMDSGTIPENGASSEKDTKTQVQTVDIPKIDIEKQRQEAIKQMREELEILAKKEKEEIEGVIAQSKVDIGNIGGINSEQMFA